MSTAELFPKKLSQTVIEAQEVRNMINALQKLFGFQVVQEGLQYAFSPCPDRHLVLSGSPSTEQLTSYIGVAGGMYDLLVDAYHREKEYFTAAVTRAEYCCIAKHAGPTISEDLLATSILEVWMLWARCPS